MRASQRVNGRHGYICECSRRDCRERIYLTIPEYERLAKIGTVVTKECAWLSGRAIVGSFQDVRVLQAANSGRALRVAQLA